MLRLDEQCDGTKIEVGVGQSFEICLQENPTTGFRWRLEQSGSPVCGQLRDAFTPGVGVPGRPGVHCWTFSVDNPGAASVQMSYRRAWDTAEAVRTFEVTVVGVKQENH